MKWFKHDSDANIDARLQEILLDYGLEGYGLYWYCLELITNKLSSDNITFKLEHDARIIARNTGSTVQKVTEMMTRFIELGLFEDVGGTVTCLKLAKRLDKSMTNSLKMRDFIADVRERHDVVSECHERLDKTRLEEEETKLKEVINDAFNRFWVAGMTKQNKQGALKSFIKQHKESKQEIDVFTGYLVNDVQKRVAANVFGFDKMHPTTYLNQKRWQDDIVKPTQDTGKFDQTLDILQNMQLEPQPQNGLLTHG